MRICVFCGSSAGHNPVYANAARETGRTIAARGMELVYGGGRVGLMGVLADAALDAGRKSKRQSGSTPASRARSSSHL